MKELHVDKIGYCSFLFCYKVPVVKNFYNDLTLEIKSTGELSRLVLSTPHRSVLPVVSAVSHFTQSVFKSREAVAETRRWSSREHW